MCYIIIEKETKIIGSFFIHENEPYNLNHIQNFPPDRREQREAIGTYSEAFVPLALILDKHYHPRPNKGH
jgi:hypothetical protein